MTLLARMVDAWWATPHSDERLRELEVQRTTLANAGKDPDWNRTAALALAQIREQRGSLEGDLRLRLL